MDAIAHSVVCPNCANSFEHNKVNGIALLEIVQTIETRKRMHCRLTLDAVERADLSAAQFRAIKKAILDGYNDLARDIHTTLGFGVDVE
jgi:hypothetical protein